MVREHVSHFDHWCLASDIDNFEKLHDLIILEQFKNIVPDYMATYINEKMPHGAIKAAVLADNYILTHKTD